MSESQYRSLAGGWSKDAICQSPGGGHLVENDIASDPHVYHDGTTFHMWFSAVNSKVKLGTAYATSPDGCNWTVWKKPNARLRDPVVDLVLEGIHTWENAGIETPHVCIGPDGIWRLYYTADMHSGPERGHGVAE